MSSGFAFLGGLFMPKAPQGRRWQHPGGPPSRLREVGYPTSVARQLLAEATWMRDQQD